MNTKINENETVRPAMLCRVDAMNRVIIPKSIRRAMRIQPGSQLEVWIQDGEIRMTKASQPVNLQELANEYISALSILCKCPAAICDTEKLLACTPELTELKGQPISDELRINFYDNGLRSDTAAPIPILSDGETLWQAQVVEPITQGDALLGAVILVCGAIPSEIPVHIRQAAQAVAALLGKSAQ